MEFEEAFEYEDTEDRLRATEEIKGTWKDPYPWTGFCGDVGFGKTEVAMRCAFKDRNGWETGRSSGPDNHPGGTALCDFHQAFLADHPVTIHCLSRFRTSNETKRIIEDIRNGSADIVIGTHRLLSKDVAF